VAVPDRTPDRRVVILAPMPLEMEAVTTAFDLRPAGIGDGVPWTGRVGGSEVTAIHIGMGPAAARAAVARLLDTSPPDARTVDHVMIAGICGGLDPAIGVGTLVNPETLVDHASGAEFPHRPPGVAPLAGKLLTVEVPTFDLDVNRRYVEQGFLAVDMESAAVAEICEARGCPWSVYRCISDRLVDGLLDERVFALVNPDGSGRPGEFERLVAAEPELLANLGQLATDTTVAARRAAEAAVRGCEALDG
jgi:adenosylhomocysteine nucleosidase